MRKAAAEEEAAARIQEKGEPRLQQEFWARTLDSRDFLSFWMNSVAWMRSKGQVYLSL